MTIQYVIKFYEIPFIGYFVLTQCVDFSAFKGNDVLHAGAILTKCKIHQDVIMIDIWCKFQRILYICYLNKAEFDDLTLIQGQELMLY